MVSPGLGLDRLESVTVGGESVELLRLGAGEPLVLVPGLAGSLGLVMPLARALARRFQVNVYALRGDRRSWGSFDPTRSTWQGIAGHADDLARLIERLGLERPTVMGVSYGGAIALELAANHPERLGSLVVAGADARFPSAMGLAIARRALERFPLPSDNRFVNQFFNLLHGSRPAPGPLAEFVTDRIWETDQTVMAARLADLEAFDVSDRLWRIDAPTLVVAGSRDVIVPARRQRILASQIDGARFELVEGAGHIGFLTHQNEIVGRVSRHLRCIEATA
jgi:pimeloyl-ACP methyl ester carboxylesterase